MDGSTPISEGAPANPRRFRMQGCLGRGGHGEVYRATMSRDGGVVTEVAVKVLAADVDPNSDPVSRLKDEGRLLGALNHPVILKVFDLVVLSGRAALVTEYIEGQDLHRCIYEPDASGRVPILPPRALVEIIGHLFAASGEQGAGRRAHRS